MDLKEKRDYFISLLVLKYANGITLSYLSVVLTPAANINTCTRVNRSAAENLMYVPYQL